jgi:polyisoprenoid-binding protein YceI
MRRLIFAVVALAVLVALGIGGWYLFIRDSPKKFTLSTPGGTQTTRSAADLAGTWRPVKPDSRAGYRVREKLAQLPAKSDAVGRTSDVSGDVTLEAVGSSLRMTAANFTVDVTTLKSDRSMRDSRIHRQGLESDQFPTATFKSTAPVDVPPSTLSGGATKVRVTGDLTLHGVTKPVTIELDVQLNESRIEVVGNYKFPFTQFGMTPPSIGGFVSVEPDATLELQLFLNKAT